MLDLSRIRAISLDLDDTLWPVWPVIAKAEQALWNWLAQQAPATAALYPSPQALRTVREHMLALRPDLAHDLSGLRRESIRTALTQAGDNPALAEPAFEAFFAARHEVDLFDGVPETLAFLAQRYPIVALTNGNANVYRMDIGTHFAASICAFDCGLQKPDVRIFELAAKTVGVDPHQVLHIGDDAHLDICGALQAGMQTVWVNPTEQPWPHADALARNATRPQHDGPAHPPPHMAKLPIHPHATVPHVAHVRDVLAGGAASTV